MRLDVWHNSRTTLVKSCCFFNPCSFVIRRYQAGRIGDLTRIRKVEFQKQAWLIRELGKNERYNLRVHHDGGPASKVFNCREHIFARSCRCSVCAGISHRIVNFGQDLCRRLQCSVLLSVRFQGCLCIFNLALELSDFFFHVGGSLSSAPHAPSAGFPDRSSRHDRDRLVSILGEIRVPVDGALLVVDTLGNAGYPMPKCVGDLRLPCSPFRKDVISSG
mmetsp:Transcript_16216/g.46730  ORF Transcript_16216/g.46730 Transcript_16216/m.46730 type:complete len:219 (-) Transcript_16216:3405-4061(-)